MSKGKAVGVIAAIVAGIGTVVALARKPIKRQLDKPLYRDKRPSDVRAGVLPGS